MRNATTAKPIKPTANLAAVKEIARLGASGHAAADACIELAEAVLFDIESIRDEPMSEAARRVLGMIERRVGHFVGLREEIGVAFTDEAEGG
jgi:hypothetical protein